MLSDKTFLKDIDHTVKRLQEIKTSTETEAIKIARAGIQLSHVLRLVGECLPQQQQEAVNRVLDLYANL